ncbi:acyl-CoA desaturase [Vibrio ostreicida]|uniref:Fatty acid desaturase n=1 Tax=Vibrio ostreicida TaxID=526588 RepID=A0ABT8BXG6_9VIBR|nr:fatty acid desaturase [Vibrio ostreicida]MDN3611703.1 fatty acid desaturase [Vibrio ostreicida]NPD10102.1 acyl-CoA desaturase [Vibrio ostreicida]
MSLKEKPPIIWLNVLLFLSTFVIAAVFAPWYGLESGYGVEHWTWLLITFSFCNLSVTAGYHRLWSHKTYEAHWSLRLLFALGGAFALQNSALHWSSDHRIHHKHVDNNDRDPYSAKRGFWYSHIGWMLRQYNQNTYTDYSNCRDLQKDKIVMWQHKYYLPLAIAMNIGVPLVLGIVYQDIIGMLLIICIVRLVLSHHSTFFINSLAHIWGSQPYTDKNTARDNAILAVFTFGEGYHNYHHIFENDYRNGIHWWQYDPTKWLIKSSSWVGLTTRLRVTPKIKIEKAMAKQALAIASKNISQHPNAKLINEALNKEFDALMKKMSDYYALKKELLESKKSDLAKKYEHSALTVRYQQMKDDFKSQRRSWQSMISQYA